MATYAQVVNGLVKSISVINENVAANEKEANSLMAESGFDGHWILIDNIEINDLPNEGDLYDSESKTFTKPNISEEPHND